MSKEKEPVAKNEDTSDRVFTDRVGDALENIYRVVDRVEEKPFAAFESSLTDGTLGRAGDKIDAAQDRIFDRLGTTRLVRTTIKISDKIENIEDRIFGLDHDLDKGAK